MGRWPTVPDWWANGPPYENMPDLLPFADVPPDALALVGGKGLSLARTSAAGLPVPPGFVVTTEAYRRLHAAGVRSDFGFVAAVGEQYQKLGGGLVAVRSSATAEDGAEASFAGQQETILGVVGTDAVLDAVERCWKSLFTERAVAYRRSQGIADDGAAMAVVVQQLIAAEVAGVLFTRDPQDPTGERMGVEASWGLGEAVVSGRVMPDRFIVARDGVVLARTAGVKAVEITPQGERAVTHERQTQLCLSDAQLSLLADLGRRVEQFYGDPRDIEWAIADGRVCLLQARPITTATAAEREQVRQRAIAATRPLADPKGTVWVRYNLSESLPEPTPMTWAVVSRMLAADGAFGALNRDLGGDPDPVLGSLGAFDLIAGRPMANLSRMPQLQFRRPPVEYPFAELKADPRKATDPKPVLAPGRVGLFHLPGVMWRLMKIGSTTKAQADTFAAKFDTLAAAFAKDATAALTTDWTSLAPPQLKKLFDEWVTRTLVMFARDSLKPTAFAEFAWSQLLDLLKPTLGEERAKVAVAELALGAKPPAAVSLADGLQALAGGALSRAEFLSRFGHRCRNEMELAQPRWSEDPAAVDKLAKQRHPPYSLASEPNAWEGIAAEAKLTGSTCARGGKLVTQLRTYLGLREAAKHYLLLGFAVLRRALVELDTRFHLNGGIFHLTPDELHSLIDGQPMADTIRERKKRRRLELSLELPPVVFSDDLDAIGRSTPAPAASAEWVGVPLSPGVAEAAALVLTEPTDPPDEPFVLVCPSTDPAWVPLFARAKAVAMETGGVLSHGAIVAREFGLPAVAGLPGLTARLTTGKRVRVDGTRGTLTLLD